jgi:microcin C transport system substrate-binding protein
MVLKSTTWATQMQMMDSRNFGIYYGSWTGSLFPDPAVSWHSKYAEIDNSNNFTGLRNTVIDSLCDVYEVTQDVATRTLQLREIDRQLALERVGAYAWYGPSSRIAHWNKFGIPAGVLNKTEDWRRLIKLWWYDAAKHRQLDSAIQDDQPMDLPSFKDVRYWLEH